MKQSISNESLNVLEIKNSRSTIKVFEDVLCGYLIINIKDWSEMCVDRGGGDDYDIEYGDAAIMLKRKDVAALIDRLNAYLDSHFYCKNAKFQNPGCKYQCTECKSNDWHLRPMHP